MPTITDMHDPYGKKQLFVEQAEIDAQARIWNILTGLARGVRSKLITTYSDTTVILVHPSVQLEEGHLEAGADEIAKLSREWDSMAKQAERAGLIHMAAGGIMMWVHPEKQLTEGIYHKIQIATGNRHRLQLAEEENHE